MVSPVSSACELIRSGSWLGLYQPLGVEDVPVRPAGRIQLLLQRDGAGAAPSVVSVATRSGRAFRGEREPVKWVQRWRDRRSAALKPRASPLEEFATEVLALIAEQPDLTLVEVVAELRKRRIRTSRSSLWRFLDRHNIAL